VGCCSGEKIERYLQALDDTPDSVGGAYITITPDARIGIFWEEIRNYKRHCGSEFEEGEKGEEKKFDCERLILQLHKKSGEARERRELTKLWLNTEDGGNDEL